MSNSWSEHHLGALTSDDWVRFCEFDLNATSFINRYVIDQRSMSMHGCAELASCMVYSIPFFFVLIVNLMVVQKERVRFPNRRFLLAVEGRLGVGALTVVLLLVSTVFSWRSELYSLAEPLLIENGILSIIWLLYTVLMSISLQHNCWARGLGLAITVFIASKAFLMIAAQRAMRFGFPDPRFWFAAAIAVCHVGLSAIGLFEFFQRRRLRSATSDGTTTQDSVDVEEESLLSNHEDDGIIDLDEGDDESSNILSRLVFWWTCPLVAKGYQRQLQQVADILPLPKSCDVQEVENQFVANTPTLFSDGLSPSLARGLLGTFGAQFFLLAIPRFLSDMLSFGGPLVLHLLIEQLEQPVISASAWIYASAILTTTLLSALLMAHYNFGVSKISLRVRAAVVTAVYDKLLKLPLASTTDLTTGQLLNYMQTDVDRLVNFCPSFHAFWSLPLQLIVALYLLYREVGWAVLAGCVAALLLLPLNKWITTKIGYLSEQLMHWKDQRVKVVSEALPVMRTVRVCAWQDDLAQRIGVLREKELHYVKWRKYIDAICVYLWAAAPVLITAAILAAHTLVLKEPLTAPKMFSALALVNMLISPLNAFPWVLNGIVEAMVSLRRLESFFRRPNQQLRDIYELARESSSVLETDGDTNLGWPLEGRFVGRVELPKLIVSPGMVVGVSGPVAAGKSSLLLALLGEAAIDSEAHNGGPYIRVQSRVLKHGIGYVAQQTWLRRGTIRSNILFGRPLDASKYTRIIDACQLRKDLMAMNGRDECLISDGGSTLSGGQRARVALARAVYQNCDLYLLDDPFAALDARVSALVWNGVVEKELKGNRKAVIVATHHTELLAKCDQLVMLGADGKIQRVGRPSELLSSIAPGSAESTANADPREIGPEEDDDRNVERMAAQTADEEKQDGAVSLSVYGAHMSAVGGLLVTLILLSLFAMQSSKNASEFWLSRWTASHNDTLHSTAPVDSLFNALRLLPVDLWRRIWTDPVHYSSSSETLSSENTYYLMVYAILVGLNSLATLARAFLFAHGGVVGARRLHNQLLQKLLNAPASWWDATPSGRVINRLCADVYTVDDALPFQLNILLASIFNLAGSLVLTLFALPLLVPVVVLLFVVYYAIQSYYRWTTVELKRLSTLTLSPLFAHLHDSAAGVATIRALGATPRMASQLRRLLTDALRAQYSSLAASQWLSVRLSLIAVVAVAAVAMGALVQRKWMHVETGLVGLAVTYALSLTGLLNGLLGSFVETEKEFVSVERIGQYLESVPDEEDDGTVQPSDVLPNVSEATYGLSIELKEVSLRYAPNLPLALTAVSLRVEAGERVALVGRTGSGKSSVLQAILRAIRLEDGAVYVGGHDATHFRLTPYRQLFGYVAQQPLLFSGTLLENLVVGQPDIAPDQVDQLLQEPRFAPLVQRLGGMNGNIEEQGRNLSAGERQLVALARVLLHRPRVVLVDEATAHLDDQTHAAVHDLLLAHLSAATMIVIAHKLPATRFFHRIFSLDASRLVASRTP